MSFDLTKEIMNNYKYLITIKCPTTNQWKTMHMPSFITNKKTSYLVKTVQDVKDIINEIFMIWRFKFHTSEYKIMKESNIEYMKEIISKIENFDMIPYLSFIINSGLNPNINCEIIIFQMKEEYIYLLTIQPDYQTLYECLHTVIPFIIFKDINPNRLEIYIVQNPKYLVSEVNQTMLMLRKIYDFNFYNENLQKIGLTIKDKENFMELIYKKKSFNLTEEDLISEKEIYYANIYFLVGQY